jgi:hypothetical protein
MDFEARGGSLGTIVEGRGMSREATKGLEGDNSKYTTRSSLWEANHPTIGAFEDGLPQLVILSTMEIVVN